jgi:hypothetical protein
MGTLDVGDVAAAALEQPLVLASLEALTDVGHAGRRPVVDGYTAPSRWSAAISSFE